MNSFGRIIDILLLCMMLFIVPLEYMAYKEDCVMQSAISTQTSLFTDTIRNKGYVDRQAYEEFIKWLEESGTVYDVCITHYKKIYTYDDVSDTEVMSYELCPDDAVKEAIYGEEGMYTMGMGDFVSVSVKNTGDTLAQKISGSITGNSDAQGIDVIYGGVIRDETY